MSVLSNLRWWYNANKRETIFAGLLFLVATTSFGIGYLASRDNTRPPIIIETCSTTADHESPSL